MGANKAAHCLLLQALGVSQSKTGSLWTAAGDWEKCWSKRRRSEWLASCCGKEATSSLFTQLEITSLLGIGLSSAPGYIIISYTCAYDMYLVNGMLPASQVRVEANSLGEDKLERKHPACP